ncbi:hypothetical protein SDC9_199687 [bioreactor metagenome]|uniref:Uncharacterized protein n=1 Tax=bioreactor metagenome TaxID=1076179 RepID=A0A645IL42_9ZZZZ
MTVRQSGSAIVIHLLNYVSAVRPIRQSAPQNHLRLEIPAGYTARELTGDIVLPRDADGRLQLPELREFMVIELRPKEDK